MKRYLVIIAATILASSCVVRVKIPDLQNATYSGETGEQTFALSEEVTSVSLAGAYDLEYIQDGTSPRIEATLPKELLEDLRVKVDGSNVRIYSESKKSGVINLGFLHNSGESIIKVYLPALSKISLAGSGDITATGISAPSFTGSIAGSGDMHFGKVLCDEVNLSVAGSGDIVVDDLDCTVLEVSVAGSGDMKVSGKAQSASLTVSGSGDIDARHLQCDDINKKVRGAGDIRL